MTRLHSVVALATALVLPIALGGCAGVLVVGGLAAAGGAGYEASNERGVQGSYDDFSIKTNIETAWIREDPAYQGAFSATVYNGQALLTGSAPNPEMKRRAFELASGVPGVKGVYDEIETGTADTWDGAKDAWITARLRSDLILERDIRSINYTIETANQSIYLMGSARSQTELDKATYLARYVPGVKRVVSYVELRSGVPAAEQRPPAYAAPYAPGNGAPPPRVAPGPSSAPVEVQRL